MKETDNTKLKQNQGTLDIAALRKWGSFAAILWTVIIIGSLWWSLQQKKYEEEKIAEYQGRMAF